MGLLLAEQVTTLSLVLKLLFTAIARGFIKHFLEIVALIKLDFTTYLRKKNPMSRIWYIINRLYLCTQNTWKQSMRSYASVDCTKWIISNIF